MDVNVKGSYMSSKGLVIIVENDETKKREDITKYWKGKRVNDFIVVGVESHAVPVIRKGDMIGLLVE